MRIKKRNPSSTAYYHFQVQDEQQEEFTDSYSVFVYAIRSSYTKESYFRRLRRSFDAIDFCVGETRDKRCNVFANRDRNDSDWAFSNILKFLCPQKERVEKKEVTAGTLRNYFKTIKMFFKVTDIIIQWKKITRGIPKGKRYADDRESILGFNSAGMPCTPYMWAYDRSFLADLISFTREFEYCNIIPLLVLLVSMYTRHL